VSLPRALRCTVLALTVGVLTTVSGPASASAPTTVSVSAGPSSGASTSTGPTSARPSTTTPTSTRPSSTAPSSTGPTSTATTSTGPGPAAPATPGTAAVPSPARAAAAAISDPTPFRGDRVTVTGTGFSPDEEVTASLPSRNRGQLGSAVADRSGRVTIAVSVPATLPDGDQEVLLSGTSGQRASTGFALRSLLAELVTRFIRWWPAG
jgi:hypothetical protein